MQNNIKKLQLPEGFKDFLPKEAYQKRALEKKWIELFESWSYNEVVSSSFEFYDTLTLNVGIDTLSLLKTIDRSGHIIALRPDMTSPIARLVATRMKENILPQRLFYLANVFRYETDINKSRQREFYQAGVELIGSSGPMADAEIIALAAKALDTAGLNNFKIGLGHIGITKVLLNYLVGDQNNVEELRRALGKKNFVELHSLLDTENKKAAEKIFKIITTHGQLDEMIDNLKDAVQDEYFKEEVENLEILAGILKTYNVADKIFLDLSILRDFEYYTGIVFEGYSSSLGYPVCGGGRYDNMLGKLGYQCPATGFALGIERVLAALDKECCLYDSVVDYFVTGVSEKKIVEKALSLRKEGFKVEVDTIKLTKTEAEEYVAKKRIKNLLIVE